MQPFRVLLINPSSERFYVPSAPLGLSCLAGTLPEGAEADGLDLNVLQWVHGLDDAGMMAAFDRYLQRSRFHHVAPDLIGMTVYEETLPQTERIVELAKAYGIPTVAGGIFPTLFPESLPDAFNWVIRGEGESAFRFLVEALMDPKVRREDLGTAIASVPYRDATCLGQNAGAPLCRALQSVRPRRDIFDGFNMGFRYYSIRMVSSSGCPYACKFCANSEFAHREWIPRPFEDVVDELSDVLQHDDAISEISFSDDQFLGFTPEHYRRARRLLESIARLTQWRNLRINLQVRADRFLEALDTEPALIETIQAINRNFTDPSAETSQRVHGRPVRGFALDIGVESFLDRRLHGMGKGITAAENVAAVHKARDLGVDLGVYMLTFTPDITLEELREEYVHFYHEVVSSDSFSKATFFGFFQELIPYRGTAIYKELADAGELVENGTVAGFRFKDPRVAGFYLQYQYGLKCEGFGTARSKGEILSWIEQIFNRSAAITEYPPAIDLVTKVICEMKDEQQVRSLYHELKSIMP